MPSTAQTYMATYNVVSTPAPLAFVQVEAATPQTNQTTVTVTYTSAQMAGDTNILAIGWNNATSNITSVTDSAGNVYQLAVPTARGSGISQAIYYAKNIKAAAAGANTVTVTFNTATPVCRHSRHGVQRPRSGQSVRRRRVGIRQQCDGKQRLGHHDRAANELIFAAGITTGAFSAAGTNFTNRIITTPDGDIAEDRFVTATGSYNATATLGSAAWLMQVATFRAASQT